MAVGTWLGVGRVGLPGEPKTVYAPEDPRTMGSHHLLAAQIPAPEVTIERPGGIDWAFYNGPPQQGTNVRNYCYDFLSSGVGAWAMEVTHILTYFGDLYQTSDGDPWGEAYFVQACGCCITRLCLTTGRSFAELFWVRAALPRSGTR